MIKRILFPSGPGFYRVRAGIARGLTLFFDPSTEASKILGLYETEIRTSFRKFTGEAGLMLDIGSFDGYYSLIYRKYNKKGRILACEAGSMVISRIEENYRRNFGDPDNFLIVNKFIGSEDVGNLTTVDRMLEQENEAKVFLKIDVEGAEADVIRGAKNTLMQKDCRLIIETHSKELEEEVMKALQDMGYKVSIVFNSRLFNRKGRSLVHNRWLVAEKMK